MKRIIALLAMLIAIAALSSCSSTTSETPSQRTDPFVGQWVSTGGSEIPMSVGSPVNGAYPVEMSTGPDAVLQMNATASGSGTYEATLDSGTVFRFSMVNDDLLNSTATPPGEASSTATFKRSGT